MGGIYNVGNYYENPLIINATISNNISGSPGAGLHFQNITDNSRIINSIIYNNRHLGQQMDAFSNSIAGNISTTMALNSIIQNGESYFGYENDQNIIFTDPLLLIYTVMITIYRIIVQHWAKAL